MTNVGKVMNKNEQITRHDMQSRSSLEINEDEIILSYSSIFQLQSSEFLRLLEK